MLAPPLASTRSITAVSGAAPDRVTLEDLVPAG